MVRLITLNIRGLSEKFADISELDFKYGRIQFLIVHLCEAICYKYLDKIAKKWIKNMYRRSLNCNA